VNVFRAAWRSVRLAGMFLAAGTELAVKRPSTREQRAEWLHRNCARVLRGLGVEVWVDGDFPEQGAVISNHLSYMDIMVFASLHRCVFVSMEEVKRWPVIGWMTTMSGTVYVARGRGGSAARAREGMAAAVDAGLPVVFFPEGKTSNGGALLKFHGGLLSQAMASGAPVTAAFLRYELVEDNGPDISVAEDICWGKRNFAVHVFKLLSLRGVRAGVRFAPEPIRFSGDGANRKMAAVEARSAVGALACEASLIGQMHHF
jgi:1-acyl-sn-glycerol-3-phosphate acyltransferase